MKSNPFERSNPFQVQTHHQSQITSSFNAIQPKSIYRHYEPQLEQLFPKQNNFLKKPQHQLWKFRQDNCGRSKVFNHQINSIYVEKCLQQRNSFQKQFVLKNIGQKFNHNPGQEVASIDRPYIENPFGRKHLFIKDSQLVESQVYLGFKGKTVDYNIMQEECLPQYQNFTPKSQLNTYNYAVYTPPVQGGRIQNKNPGAQTILSAKDIQLPLQQKYKFRTSQYESKKSIEKDEIYNYKQGIFKYAQNSIENRLSLDKDKQINLSRFNSLKQISLKEVESQNYAEKDHNSRRFSKVSEKQQEKVSFGQSDDQQRNFSEQIYQKEREPTFGPKSSNIQLTGPPEIQINGCKFYRQNVLCS